MSNLIKVNIATAIVLIIVSILLVANQKTAKNASDISAAISTRVLPSVNALHDMRFGVSRIVSSSNELLVLSAIRKGPSFTHSTKTTQELTSISHGRSLFNRGLLEFQKNHLADVGLSSHGTLLNDLELKFLALTNTSDIIIEIALQPFEPRSIAKLKDEFEQHENDVLKIIEKILTLESTHSAHLLREGMASIDKMEFQTISLAGIFFIVIVVYSIFVLNALSNESKSRSTSDNAIREKSIEVQRRIKLEKSLAHSRKLDSLGTLAGGIAHELNNQLLPVMTMAELIFNRMDKNHPDHRKLEIILLGTQHARTTVAKISNFSRTGEGRADSCNAIEVCKNTKDVLLAGCPTNVQIIVDIQDDDGLVHMAADDLQGILVNLFSNGVDAMDGSEGEIHIKGRQTDINDYSNAHGLTPGSYIKISLQDDGSGIPHDMVDRVFDPFFTTKEPGKGVGLGMAIVHTTIEEAGGKIWLESKFGVGTTFIIHLPIMTGDNEA